MKKTITINVMMCMHCANRVENALKKLQGVEKVTINLNNRGNLSAWADTATTQSMGFYYKDSGVLGVQGNAKFVETYAVCSHFEKTTNTYYWSWISWF